jgi:hypothetical protein
MAPPSVQMDYVRSDTDYSVTGLPHPSFTSANCNCTRGTQKALAPLERDSALTVKKTLC